jgi:hypothetical protein
VWTLGCAAPPTWHSATQFPRCTYLGSGSSPMSQDVVKHGWEIFH